VNNETFKNICVRVPVADIFHSSNRRKRGTETVLKKQKLLENTRVSSTASRNTNISSNNISTGDISTESNSTKVPILNSFEEASIFPPSSSTRSSILSKKGGSKGTESINISTAYSTKSTSYTSIFIEKSTNQLGLTNGDDSYSLSRSGVPTSTSTIITSDSFILFNDSSTISMISSSEPVSSSTKTTVSSTSRSADYVTHTFTENGDFEYVGDSEKEQLYYYADYYEDDNNYDFNILWDNEDEDPDNSDITTDHTEKPDTMMDWAAVGKNDLSDNLPDDIYCDLVNTLNDVCLHRSLLEIWQFDEERIMSVSQQEILDAVNLLTSSPWFYTDTQYANLLGGITNNSTGHIVSATTADMYWAVQIQDNVTLVVNRGAGFEDQFADAKTLDWEEEFISSILSLSFDNTTVLPYAGRSFGDISEDAIFFDGFKMAGGYLLMFIFTVIMLGRFNYVEMRLYLSIAGIVGITMGFIISLGLSSLLGYPYTPMHTLLPFLLLGIGIDDMFVITQSWSNLNKDSHTSAIPLIKRVGFSLQHAGVAITVTSITDICAFGIGAISKMPGLVSFCISCAIGLASIYILSISWFVAWMSLDESRIIHGRNGIVPCVIHSDIQSSNCSANNTIQLILNKGSRLIMFPVYLVVVILVTIGLLMVGVWGSLMIVPKFDVLLIMPEGSYAREYYDIHNKEYFKEGKQLGSQFGYWGSGYVYIGSFNYTQLDNMDALVNGLVDLKNSGQYIGDLDPWWLPFKMYAKTKKNITSWKELSSPEQFGVVLSDFLFSEDGTIYQPNFRWDGELVCNHPAPNITATRLSITYLNLDDYPEKHSLAKEAVNELVEKANFSSNSFSHVNLMYLVWENEEIVGTELWRNVGMAMVVVFAVTFFFLANLPICSMVLLCVILTLVDTVGFLFFWNIDMNFLTMVYVIIAVGLCVDYSTHIAHSFMVSKGTRTDRAMNSLTSIGPAVFNGGITTFLALVLLGFSTTHVFITFFKVFVLTVIFGLFHGLVFFPVILSIIGPKNNSENSSPNSTETNSSCSESDEKGVTNMSFVSDIKLPSSDPSSASVSSSPIQNELEPVDIEQDSAGYKTFEPWLRASI
jgi:hypothetical protein